MGGREGRRKEQGGTLPLLLLLVVVFVMAMEGWLKRYILVHVVGIVLLAVGRECCKEEKEGDKNDVSKIGDVMQLWLVVVTPRLKINVVLIHACSLDLL